jgi:hypothetical protein
MSYSPALRILRDVEEEEREIGAVRRGLFIGFDVPSFRDQ